MFDKITSWDNLLNAYKKTQRGKLKHKVNAIKYNQDYIANLKDLQRRLITGDYRPKQYSEFYVKEPKVRLIYAPAFEDKIVHHAVNNVLRDHFEPKFIKDSYACIRNKGNARAVKSIQNYARISKQKYEKPYFIKTDVSKFFYSINHETLKLILKGHNLDNNTYKLLETIIDASPTKDVGLPLGNLISQLLANIYMSKVDHFIKRFLKVKYYVRYSDDLVMVVKDEDTAKVILKSVRDYLLNTLSLNTPDSKSFYKPVTSGLNCLGFNVKHTHISLLGKHKRNFRKLSNHSKCGIHSWLSFAKTANCKYFINTNLGSKT